MSILVVGLGVIGTTYGYLFQKAGHHVEHLVRQSSTRASVSSLEVEILDGRTDPKGSLTRDQYNVHHQRRTSYDLIVVSVPQGRIAEAMADLRTGGIEGPVLLFCGFWGEREELDRLMAGRDVLLGYPVAGGSITGERLTCCVFDHIMLERRDKARFPGYERVEALFGSCGVGFERPHDMLEWIWLHMAINAGVGAVAAMYGDVEDTTRAAEQLMGSTRMLARVVKAIRETSRIVASRGVDLRRYRGELGADRPPMSPGVKGLEKVASCRSRPNDASTTPHSPRLHPGLETPLSLGNVLVLLLQSDHSASLVAEAERELMPHARSSLIPLVR